MNSEQLKSGNESLAVDEDSARYQSAAVNSPWVPPGYKQSEVGVIPCDWGIRQIIEVCDFIVPGRNKPKFFNGDIPWVTTPDMEDGGMVAESRLGLSISRHEAKNVGSRVVPAGSIVMSCVGELGIVAYATCDIVINQQLHAFIPSDLIDGHFLMYAIKTRKSYLESIATKTALPYLNKENCNSIRLPIPPLAEQRAIAAALSDVDALLAKLDQLIAKKRDLKQAAMQQLLNGQTRLPGFSGEWMVKRVGELFDVFAGGDFNASCSSILQDERHPFPIYSNSITDAGLYGFCSYGISPSGSITITARGTLGIANYRDHRYTAIGRVLVLQPK